MLDWEDVADESSAEEDENDVPDMTAGGAPCGASSNSNIPQIDDLSYLQNRKLVLPSNLNANPQYSKDELSIRQEQASGKLNHLRDLIAEKSFQYSGVIRVGRKHMKLHSRDLIRKINHQIAIHCSVYNRCCTKMIILGADSSLMQERFKELKKEDIKTSTAILDPNTPGSTQVQLSWFWQTVCTRILPPRTSEHAPHDTTPEDPATVMECGFSISQIN